METDKFVILNILCHMHPILTDTMTWWALNANIQKLQDMVPRDTAKKFVLTLSKGLTR